MTNAEMMIRMKIASRKKKAQIEAEDFSVVEETPEVAPRLNGLGQKSKKVLEMLGDNPDGQVIAEASRILEGIKNWAGEPQDWKVYKEAVNKLKLVSPEQRVESKEDNLRRIIAKTAEAYRQMSKEALEVDPSEPVEETISGGDPTGENLMRNNITKLVYMLMREFKITRQDASDMAMRISPTLKLALERQEQEDYRSTVWQEHYQEEEKRRDEEWQKRREESAKQRREEMKKKVKHPGITTEDDDIDEDVHDFLEADDIDEF